MIDLKMLVALRSNIDIERAANAPAAAQTLCAKPLHCQAEQLQRNGGKITEDWQEGL